MSINKLKRVNHMFYIRLVEISQIYKKFVHEKYTKSFKLKPSTFTTRKDVYSDCRKLSNLIPNRSDHVRRHSNLTLVNIKVDRLFFCKFSILWTIHVRINVMYFKLLLHLIMLHDRITVMETVGNI